VAACGIIAVPPVNPANLLAVRASRCGAAGRLASGDLARRSGDCARRAGEAERTDTAARESEITETDDVFLAYQRISACADIAVAVAWFAAERWSLMDGGNLRRNNARKRESGEVVLYLRDSISAIIAEGRRSPRGGGRRGLGDPGGRRPFATLSCRRILARPPS
jgi:hypothetical protein